MISERKTLHGMLRASVLLICIFSSISLCTAQQKDDTQLIELMDVMLEDFLNPRQTAPIVEQKPRVLQDSAIPMESAPITSSTLPQASSPSMPVHVPLAEDYSYTEPKQNSAAQTVPSQSVTTPQQYSQPQYTQTQQLPQTQPVYSQPQYTEIQPVYTQPAQTQPQYTQPQPVYTQTEPDYVDIQPIYAQDTQSQPVYTQPAQTQPQYTQTQPIQTQPVQSQPQYTQAQPVQSQPVQPQQPEPAQQAENVQIAEADTDYPDIAIDDDELGSLDDIQFTEEMLQENYFQPVNTLTANIEYNSYNSKFRTLGGSVMFDHSFRQNSAIGFLTGGFIDFSDGFKIKGLNFSKIILEAELALFYRHYIMSDSMKAKHPYGWGFYLQPELGAAVAFNKTGLIKDQLGLKVSPLGALRVGYRYYIRKSPLYIEPFLRVGYPFVAGGGIGFGLQL
ncbi:MAG: hypothetical protein J5798_03220 [Spirochaetaceae bacterium]|nr:hypothetical protein [Spirochaetaceae bacterium]